MKSHMNTIFENSIVSVLGHPDCFGSLGTLHLVVYGIEDVGIFPSILGS
jgi:hypothetical protein